jgi:hypothetical protein
MTQFLPLILEVVSLAAKLYPDVVAAIHAIQTSTTTSEEERAQALEALRATLTNDVARVGAVTFKDV